MKKTKDRNIRIAWTLNILITIMTIVTLLVSYTGYRFMQGYEPSSEVDNVQILNYFTVQSNIFMGIVSFIFAIKEIQLLKGKIKKIPLRYYILKMVATVAISLTLLVVFIYLGFVTKGGIISLLRNSNMFFHFIIPIISIITFILCEKTDSIKFKYTVYGVVPTALYEIFYISNILSNIDNGKVSTTYDWYMFLQNGVGTALIVAPLMLGFSYLITLVIWKLNRVISKGIEIC